jgi:hypothetical protein
MVSILGQPEVSVVNSLGWKHLSIWWKKYYNVLFFTGNHVKELYKLVIVRVNHLCTEEFYMYKDS